MNNILWFEKIGREDIPEAGGKGANLGEMLKAGIPVPPGFIVTASAYFRFIQKTKIDKLIKKELGGLDPENTKKLNAAAKTIQKAILGNSLSVELEKDIKQAYRQLYTRYHTGIFVAVRSSATAEDLPEASFAGQQATFLNISGPEEVIKAVRRCWASLFEPRAIYYRVLNKFDHLKVKIAVPVQAMVQSEKSGVLFTLNPVTNDPSQIVIEAGLGLGEAVVSGSINPDRYIVDKKTYNILDRQIKKQTWKITNLGGRKSGTKHVEVPKNMQERQKLLDDEIKELSKIAGKIENHYQFPQDLEWAIEPGSPLRRGKIYIVQTRPVTTTKKKVTVPVAGAGKEITPKAEIILQGVAASIGMASGLVKVIHSTREIDQIQKGDVLVTEMTNPSFVPAMRRASAIVTDSGGLTSHAAIVSREMGIPCVVGTGTATSTLKTGMIITVDGANGLIYKGEMKKAAPQIIAKPTLLPGTTLVPVTGTKVYVNLAEVELAESIAQLPVDGVGLLRAEFMIANIGEHPKAMLQQKRGEEFSQKIAENLRIFCQAFHPRPVVYRATDFKTNEYRNLKGGEEFEPKEENPMLGFRGAFRYIKEPEVFKLELEAIKLVREKYDLKNLWLMIPFVRTVEELKQVKILIEESGLKRSKEFKLWMMAEVPSNVILLEDFISVGIDGVSIGSNDLTQLILGADRDNAVLAEEFDERNKAVILSLQKIIHTCRRWGITSSICGQAPSVYPEITEAVVRAGITSVSVNPDMIIGVRKLIASIEKRILLDYLAEKE